VAAQSVAPIEVILVDNNCTDGTVRIARQFPFVTVIREKRQGLIPARDKGFDYAKGDILARIDADTRIGPDWVKTVRTGLSERSVHAVTGPAKAIVDIHLPFLYSKLWSSVYFKFIRRSWGIDVLWGPNMAIEKKAYKKIKSGLSKDSTEVHEDQDISILMHKKGLGIKILPGLNASVDGSRAADIRKILEYDQRRRRTFKLHNQAGNIKRKKLGTKDRLVLAAMVPLGIWAMAQGVMYNLESWLGLRR
jgi:glycosyltransferase involved in cell wall biosynthesis